MKQPASQRKFGEPIVEPLTIAFKDLTSYLSDNENVFAKWGQYVGDTIRGVDTAAKELSKTFSETSGGGKSNFDTFLSGIGAGLNVYGFLGKQEREKLEEAKALKEGLKLLRPDNTFDFNAGLTSGKTADEIITEQKRLADDAARERERQRLNDLASLKDNASAAETILKNRYSVEQSLLDVNIRYTQQQELEYVSKAAQIKQNFYQSERGRLTGYYNKLIELAGAGTDEALKAEIDRNKELSNLHTQETQEAYQFQRRVLEIEKQIQDERRQVAIESVNLQTRGVSQAYSSQIFEIEKALYQGKTDFQNYYSDLSDIENNSFNKSLSLLREQNQLQLENQSLSVEQKGNLIKQGFLDEQNLTLQHSQKLFDIEKNRLNQQKQLVGDYYNFVNSTLSNQSNFIQDFSNLIFGDKSTGQRTNTLFDSVSTTGGSQISDINKQIAGLNDSDEKLGALLDRMKQGDKEAEQIVSTMAHGGGAIARTIDGVVSDIVNKNTRLRIELTAQREEIEKANAYLQPLFDKVKAIKKSFVTTPEGVDNLNFEFLTARQGFDVQQINNQIREQQDLLKISNKGSFEYQQTLNNISKLEQERATLGIKNLGEQENAYRNSIAGLREYVKTLADGDKQTTAFAQNSAIKSILNEQTSLLEGNILLQEKLSNFGADASARYQNAWLSAILAVKDANVQAVESQIQSQVKLADSAVLHTEQVRARVLAHLAEQKTLSEAFADGIISAFDKLTGFLNKSLGKIGDIPIIGDLLKFANSQITTNLTKGLLDAIFPSKLVEAFTSSKNPIAQPIVSKLDQTNQILNSIANKLGTTPTLGGAGGGGLGGIIQSIFGNVLGGGSNARNTSNGNVVTTPPFNPNTTSNNSIGYGTRTGDIVNGAVQVFAGDKGRNNIFSNLKNIFSGKDGSLFGKGGVFGEKGFGNNVGTYGAIGTGASILGNLIGGRFGGFISGAGQGLAIGAQIGSMIFPGIGTAIGAIGGALIGGIASLFSDKKRKADKNENLPKLQEGFKEAFAQLQQLAADKNAFYNDPDGTIQKAQELRQQIASGFNVKFESKKYRNIAQQQTTQKLAEADQIIKQMQGTRDQVSNARVIDEQLNANFATGVYMDKAFLKQYSQFKRRNGMLAGQFLGIDNLPSFLSSGEMVLNPMQINAVIQNAGGVDVFKGAGIPNYNTGAFIGSPTPVNSNNQSNRTFSNSAEKQPINLTLIVNNSGIVESDIEDVIIDSLDNSYEVRTKIVNTYDKEKTRMR